MAKKFNEKPLPEKDGSLTCPRCAAATMRKRLITMPGDDEQVIWRCPNCKYSEWDNPHLNDPEIGDGSRDLW